MSARFGALLLAAALALGASGCAVVSPRQTLAVLDDGTVAYAEGRKDVCLAVEDADGQELSRVCDVIIDPLQVGETALFHTGGRVVAIAVLPLDVAELRVQAEGGLVEVVEPIESDITTGFAVLELDPALGAVTLVGVDANGGLVDESDPIELPPSGETSHASLGS